MRQKGMNCSMKRDECFRLGRVIIYMQMYLSNALEAELSKYSISLGRGGKKCDGQNWSEKVRKKGRVKRLTWGINFDL